MVQPAARPIAISAVVTQRCGSRYPPASPSHSVRSTAEGSGTTSADTPATRQ
ncbi:hypothetical protein D3C72_2365650 [compost metagenome]